MDRKTTQQRGVPDFMFAYVRAFGVADFAMPTAVEVKVGTNKLTEDQEGVRTAMEKNGWQYFVVSSLEELMKVVRL